MVGVSVFYIKELIHSALLIIPALTCTAEYGFDGPEAPIVVLLGREELLTELEHCHQLATHLLGTLEPNTTHYHLVEIGS